MSAVERAAHPLVPAPAPARGMRLADDERRLSRVLLAPSLVYIAALVGAPFVLALIYSLTSISLGGHSFNFVGLQNFRAAARDGSFWNAFWNTILFAFASQILVLILASALAIALQRDFRGKWLVRLLILLPWVAPISLGTIGWLWILDSIYSVINWTLRAVHVFGPSTWPIWLGQPRLAMASIITVHIWRTLPLATVILLGGLSGIPQDIHDAAEVDGAGFFRHMFQITIPLVLPIALVATLFGFVFAFTDMIVVFVLTRGGPFDTTQVLASLAFYKSVDGGDLGGGAAVALVLFPFLAAAAVGMLRMARRAEVV